MIGKLVASNKAHFSTNNASKAAAQAGERLDLLGATKLDGSNLPRASESAFRKRPVRLIYDKNEFWSFRLPSESAFLMGSFDKGSLFGTRHGL